MPVVQGKSVSVVPALGFADNVLGNTHSMLQLLLGPAASSRRVRGGCQALWLCFYVRNADCRTAMAVALCLAPVQLSRSLYRPLCSDARCISLLLWLKGVPVANEVFSFLGCKLWLYLWCHLSSSLFLPFWFFPTCPPSGVSKSRSLRHTYMLSRESYVEL